MNSRQIRAHFALALALAVAAILPLAGCGGGGGGGGNPGGLLATIVGKIFAPDGVTPVAGARIFIPAKSREGAALTETTSDQGGNFTLPNVPAGEQNLMIMKGAWTKSITLNVTAGQEINLPAGDTTLPSNPNQGAPRIAVVTGSFDELQDVLAKLGMGDIDEFGALILGTETFTLYDGDGSLEAPYQDATVLNDPTELAKYDIIFLNCGLSEDLIQDPGMLQNIRTFVANGGKIYATDWAYNYIEQAFPSAIDFFGSTSGNSDTAEEPSAAKMGQGGLEFGASSQDAALTSWLSARGALDDNGKIPLTGLVGGWVMIDGVNSTTKTWVRGVVPTGIEGKVAPGKHTHVPYGADTRGTPTREDVDRHLTVTFNHGLGRVLYTSYHTVDTQGPELRPQEQVLAYLVFEL